MPTLIQKQRELFDEKFGVNETTNYWKGFAVEIKSFLTTCLIEHYEEDIRELEGRKTHLHGDTEEDAIMQDAHNEALSLAISLLQDKIKELKK